MAALKTTSRTTPSSPRQQRDPNGLIGVGVDHTPEHRTYSRRASSYVDSAGPRDHRPAAPPTVICSRESLLEGRRGSSQVRGRRPHCAAWPTGAGFLAPPPRSRQALVWASVVCRASRRGTRGQRASRARATNASAASSARSQTPPRRSESASMRPRSGRAQRTNAANAPIAAPPSTSVG